MLGPLPLWLFGKLIRGAAIRAVHNWSASQHFDILAAQGSAATAACQRLQVDVPGQVDLLYHFNRLLERFSAREPDQTKSGGDGDHPNDNPAWGALLAESAPNEKDAEENEYGCGNIGNCASGFHWTSLACKDT